MKCDPLAKRTVFAMIGWERTRCQLVQYIAEKPKGREALPANWDHTRAAALPRSDPLTPRHHIFCSPPSAHVPFDGGNASLASRRALPSKSKHIKVSENPTSTVGLGFCEWHCIPIFFLERAVPYFRHAPLFFFHRRTVMVPVAMVVGHLVSRRTNRHKSQAIHRLFINVRGSTPFTYLPRFLAAFLGG